MITFDRLKHLSFLHSAIYLVLLAAWATGHDSVKYVCGWGHGIGWIVMSLLCLAAVRRRVIPLWLAVMVSIVGCVGPFVGSIAFVVCERREESLEPVSGQDRAPGSPVDRAGRRTNPEANPAWIGEGSGGDPETRPRPTSGVRDS